MSRSRRNGWLVGTVITAIALVAIATVGALETRVGPFGEDAGPVALNRLAIDFALCPPDLPIAAGTEVERECREPVAGLDVQVASGDTEAARSSIGEEVAFDDLPNGAIRLHVDGVADGTIDVLSCRSYAQDERIIGNVMSLVRQVAYGTEPMTASIIAQPYVIAGSPDNRWQAVAADPTAEQLAGQPATYGTVFRCTCFLLPPGGLAGRPGWSAPGPRPTIAASRRSTSSVRAATATPARPTPTPPSSRPWIRSTSGRPSTARS